MSNEFAADYEDVAVRLAKFHEKHPNGRIVPVDPFDPFQICKPYGEDGPTMLVYQAAVYREQTDVEPAAIGIAWELVPGRTPYTKGSEVMVAQTSAVGRALSLAGFSSRKSIASKQEVTAAKERAIEPMQFGGSSGPSARYDHGAGRATDKQVTIVRDKLRQLMPKGDVAAYAQQASVLIGRQIETLAELTKAEASVLIQASPQQLDSNEPLVGAA